MTVRSTTSPRLWPLAWPMFVELGLGIAIGIGGTALASRAGDTAAAAFALSNHVAGMLFIFFRIVGAGIGVVVTQSLGAARPDAARAAARAAIGASTWVGGACALAALVGAGPVLALMGAPADVRSFAEPFLRWLAPVMLLDAWNASMAAVTRAHLRSRDALAVILVVHAVHLALVVPLMSGFGPLPPQGLAGYAMAALASRAVGLALHLAVWRWRLDLVPRTGDWWRLPRAELRAILHIGLPGAAENIGYRLAFVVSVAVVAQGGAQALATHAYVSQITYAGLLFGLATGLAVEVLVGHLVGAGRLRDAQALVRRALARGLVVSIVVTGLIAIAAPWLLGLFTEDPSIVRLGTTLLWWTVLLEPGRTFNLVLVNALRAGGDARFPVAAGAVSMVVVLAGGSWLLGSVAGLGLVGVWIAYIADEWIRGVVMWWRWRRRGWVPHARASRRRLLREA